MSAAMPLVTPEPGLVPLEQAPGDNARFGQIPIPKFGRRLLFSPVPELGGRRVEWVPEWVAQYMKDRFNKRNTVVFEVAADLLQQKYSNALKDQVRGIILDILQEPAIQAAIAAIAAPPAAPATGFEPHQLRPLPLVARGKKPTLSVLEKEEG